jgi:hypothetical protein
MAKITVEAAQLIESTPTHESDPASVGESAQTIRPSLAFSNQPDGNGVSWEEWVSALAKDAWAFVDHAQNPEDERSRILAIVPQFAPEPKWSCEIKTLDTGSGA